MLRYGVSPIPQFPMVADHCFVLLCSQSSAHRTVQGPVFPLGLAEE